MSAYPVARLLIMDEQLSVCAVLTRALEAMGYCVETATSAERALVMLETQSFDVIVFDPSMAGVNGQDMMYQLRSRSPEMVIILLTREASVEGAIAAVKWGANDYVVKPADLHGLGSAVIEALQRRSGQIRRHATLRVVGEMIVALQEGKLLDATRQIAETKTPYMCYRPPVRLDCQHQVVVVEGEPRQEHRLTRGETTILRALMTHAGETVSWKYLAAALSDREGDGEHTPNAVRRYVHRLRRKIESNPATPRMIRTTRGKGYLFAEA